MTVFMILLRVFLFVFIPAFIIYITSENGLLDILKDKNIIGESFDVSSTKQTLLIIGIIISNLFLVILYELKNHSSTQVKSKNLALMNQVKTSFLLGMGSILNDQHASSIKFHVFRERKTFPFLRKQTKDVNPLRVYQMKYINGLSDEDRGNSLQFEVSPNLQGLVGKCYNDGEIVYEEDISILNKQYNLNASQISRTRDIKFCMAIPIYNNDSEIVTILTLDCIYCIKIDNDNNNVANMINVFIQDLCKFYPRLIS